MLADLPVNGNVFHHDEAVHRHLSKQSRFAPGNRRECKACQLPDTISKN
ncbi:hypothetical protein ALO83_103977 [Pseudomonas cannabina pv. alisalensis]|uniref:Uncharacterized protein n=1 Tax=Pseudomonas cannabina TaxID=86840 RepID=A0A3M3RV07_PSECA|nr:Unknown protein sequence [Pseudomonas syringae pv. maculicola]KPW15767.1 hypothetical protein ALO83_103977 [Pseudomonas cannabina pv. alisalensis]RMN74911.1 hypothetical protein ALQ53_103715 [Pseudomonas cannabina]RMN79170.1 hypothetical protein ALQ52_104704 [Pseudomonas cannabina pv. alisalensis]RMO00239.1 hypothetical protein ALQ51_102312 [Pseudomonas cannabina]